MKDSKQDKATSEKRDNQQDARFVEIGTIETKPKTKLAEYTATGKGLGSIARVTSDGRIVISLDVKKDLPDIPTGHAPYVEEFAVDKSQWSEFPKMNILICIVGSRGDVQPYVALGKLLLKDGHRVRLATHETFRTFVSEEHGLEFFDIGGNPQDLMSYMVKNPGLMPGIESLTNGDIGKKRKMLAEMMNGCWLACHSPDQRTGQSFVADAIISNPPAFAHIHCAEALGIPLLMSFTMPWCATTAFPHPLVNISSSNAQSGLNNVISYALAELLTWQGVGDLINDFRKNQLALPSLSLSTGPGILERAKVPWTYCMSSGLVPKPDDWKNNIDVVGFYFLDLATSYKPPEDLARFLADGEPPVYIGFGSVVVDDPQAMSKTIFEATNQAGIRALVSAGWGGLGGMSIPDHVFILGNVPHDWLFSENRVSAVVHHGGAGTTAIGLAKGRPTVIVPFFGDQLFWGQMIHQAGAGPDPIPHKELTVDNLRDALKFALSPSAQTAAKNMAQQIHDEDGTKKGVESFYKHLPLLNMRCDLDQQRVAVWWSTEFVHFFS
jgi:sterol 3beta-glucosyltransferase